MGTSNNLQVTGWKKSLLLGLVAISALVLVLGFAAQTVGQEKPGTAANHDSAEVQNEAGSTSLMQDLSVWHILRMTDWLFWPFVALTAGGLMLLIFRSLMELQEKKRSEILYAEIDRLRDMQSLLAAIQNSASNRAARLFRQTVFTFNKTGRAEPIRDDANQFLSGERDSFETFNRVVNFLSDTAGALGLLGTVWGIFATFHSGRLDGPTILQGMSVSLVTTLVGLIISSILNMGGTAVFALFNKQLNLLSSRAEQVRQALLNLEKRTQTQAPMRPPEMQPQDNHAQPVPAPGFGAGGSSSPGSGVGDDVNHQQEQEPAAVSPNPVPAAVNEDPPAQYQAYPGEPPGHQLDNPQPPSPQADPAVVNSDLSSQYQDERMNNPLDDAAPSATPGVVPAVAYGDLSSQYRSSPAYDQLDNELVPATHKSVSASMGGDLPAQYSNGQMSTLPDNRQPATPGNPGPAVSNSDLPAADNGSHMRPNDPVHAAGGTSGLPATGNGNHVSPYETDQPLAEPGNPVQVVETGDLTGAGNSNHTGPDRNKQSLAAPDDHDQPAGPDDLHTKDKSGNMSSREGINPCLVAAIDTEDMRF